MNDYYECEQFDREQFDPEARKDVKGVNYAFLAIVVIPELLAIAGFGRLIHSYTAVLIFSQVVYAFPILIYLAFFKRSLQPCRFKKIRVCYMYAYGR